MKRYRLPTETEKAVGIGLMIGFLSGILGICLFIVLGMWATALFTLFLVVIFAIAEVHLLESMKESDS